MRLQVPRILIVLLVPEDHSAWLRHFSHNRIELAHCAYWRSLYGMPATPQASTTVDIQTDHEFTLEALHQMIQFVGAGAVHL